MRACPQDFDWLALAEVLNLASLFTHGLTLNLKRFIFCHLAILEFDWSQVSFELMSLAIAFRCATFFAPKRALLVCQCVVVAEGSHKVGSRQQHQRNQHGHGNLAAIVQETDLISDDLI